MKKLRLATVIIVVALLFILMAFNGSFDTIEAEDLETDNITLDVMSDVKAYIISTGLPTIRLQQQLGLLSDNETGYDWDCDDYARALAEQARIDGVEIGLALIFIERYNGDVKVHMTNFAIIKNRIVEVSAQTGNVKEYWYGYIAKVDWRTLAETIIMPYKDKLKDRLWHRNHMRLKRKLLNPAPKSDIVTPSTLNSVTPYDADGNVIYEDWDYNWVCAWGYSFPL